MKVKLSDILEEYTERNTKNEYKPVAVGRYGIRARESIYSKELAKDYSKNKIIRQNTLTIGMGSKQIDIGILHDDVVYSVSPAYHTYKIKFKNTHYLEYLLQAHNSRMLSRYANRGSRQGKTLNFRHWLQAELYIHNEQTQYNIVMTLDFIKKMLDRYRGQLQHLDTLVKAQFVEMFGREKYRKVSLNELIREKGEYGAQSATRSYDSNRPRYIRITDINDDGTLNSNFASSSNPKDDNHYKLSYGDFLFARMGATVGKTYAYKTGNQIYAGYLIRYKLDTKKILPEYLEVYTRLKEYNEWIKLNQSGAAQPGINAKKYNSLRMPLAPMCKQNDFLKLVHQVDKSKFTIQKTFIFWRKIRPP